MPDRTITRRSLLTQAVGAAALVTAVHPSAAETAPAPPRIRETFDFGWKFLKGDHPGAQQPEFSDSDWRPLDLPHDWSIEGPYSADEKAQGSLPTGIAWYRKRFRAPESFAGRRVTLEFDGVYQNSEVWINGQYLGKRPYGYIPFNYDITPHLLVGGDNVVAVKVDNSKQSNCRWYSGSGIYRHVWLVATNQVHVAEWGTFVTCPRAGAARAMVQVKTRVRNDGKAASACTLVTTLIDQGGRTVDTIEAAQEIGAASEYEFVQQIRVDRPSLWSCADPYLYKVHSQLKDAARVLDEYDTPMGIREALFDANQGFLLNGKRVKLNGVCLHHEAGSMGAAVPERVWERRLELLREMGCNAIRTSHNPYAAEFLDLCDRMGFLVMNEAFDEWKVGKSQIGPYGYANYFDEWYERDVRNFVRRDRNHPSVAIWSAGNEILDQGEPHGAETLRELLEVFHTEDPTRPVTAGCDHIESEPPSETARPEFLALLDVVGYNYVDRWRDRAEKYYSIDKAAFPQRRVIGTESINMGGVRGSVGGGRGIDTEQLWKFVATYDYVAGDFMWTGIDYLGESRWPGKGSTSGVLDTCGFKKDGYYFYQSQWTAKPMLHLFPHWNWKGREGQFIPVTCYTNCDAVELFINGRSAGVKGYAFPRRGMEGRYGNYPARMRALRTTNDLHLSWDIPYEPGTLKAVGTKDGKVVCTEEVSTTGDPAAVELTVDRGAIPLGREGIAHVTVRILDDKGRMAPTASNEVAFAVEGEARIIGVDNGDPQSHEDYKASRRKAFNGMCLAILQSTGKAGGVKVTATAAGLRAGSVAFECK